jgi:5-methylcytosine-specific restriction endonuclease McrA
MKRPGKAPALKNGKPRNYKREYAQFHGKPEQVALRSARNKARKDAETALGMELPTDIEVDHKDPLSQGGSNNLANLELMPRYMNRRKAASSYSPFRRQSSAPVPLQPLDLKTALMNLRDYGLT